MKAKVGAIPDPNYSIYRVRSLGCVLNNIDLNDETYVPQNDTKLESDRVNGWSGSIPHPFMRPSDRGVEICSHTVTFITRTHITWWFYIS